MPVYKKEEAKSGGFQQVREAIQAFEGDVSKVEEGQWGGQLVDDKGKPRPPKGYFEIETTNNIVIEATEDLSMDIAEKFSFRINMSEYLGSFWVVAFLESADRNKVLLPDGLKGNRVMFRKMTLEGSEPKFNVTNFVIDKVVKKTVTAPKIVAKTVAKPTIAKPVITLRVSQPQAAENASVAEDNTMELALSLAIGKTEQQFRSAAGLHPKLIGSQLLPLIKAGLASQALIADGKMILGEDGKYQKVE